MARKRLCWGTSSSGPFEDCPLFFVAIVRYVDIVEIFLGMMLWAPLAAVDAKIVSVIGDSLAISSASAHSSDLVIAVYSVCAWVAADGLELDASCTWPPTSLSVVDILVSLRVHGTLLGVEDRCALDSAAAIPRNALFNNLLNLLDLLLLHRI